MSDHPRVTFVAQPTPLTRLDRLSDELGIDLWIKRDDLAGPSIGGNKARQLEYYFGAARAMDADTILITGAVQSNFVRTAAACANALGMKAIVQLEERVADTDGAYRRSGNVFLSELLGAQILTYAVGEDESGADKALFARAEALKSQGHRPYVIPLGEGHPPLGALGYVRGAQEVLAQDDGFDTVVVASGSAATHAGLLTGLRGAGHGAAVIGSCVRRAADLQRARVGRVIARLVELEPQAALVREADIEIWEGAFAPGYGQINERVRGAMAMLARFEGLLVDPVYTAKSFAAIPALVEDGRIAKGSRVCFIHTGGLAGLFAYESILRPT